MKKLLTYLLAWLCFPAFAQDVAGNAALEMNDSLYNALETGNLLYGADAGHSSVSHFSLRSLCPVTPSPATGGLAWAATVSKAMSLQLGVMYQWPQARIEKETPSPAVLFDLLPKASPGAAKLRSDWMKQTQEVLATSEQFQVRAFVKLFNNNASDASASIGQKQFAMKRSLSRKHPVVLCMVVDEAFGLLKNNTWIPAYTAAKPVFQPVLVVGYDDTRQAFEIAHPAGKAWGNGGFAWVRYHDLVHAKYAFELTMDARRQPPAPIARKQAPKTKPATRPVVLAPGGKIAPQRKYAIELRGNMVLNTVDAAGNYVPVLLQHNPKGFFEPSRAFGVSSQFQMLGTGAVASSYIYVLSVDPHGKAELHYPYQKRYGMGVTEMSSPMVPDTESQVVIPEPIVRFDENGAPSRKEQVFIKEHPGTDWLITLYSDRRLDEEIPQLLRDLSGHHRDFLPRFRQVFGAQMAPKGLVSFEKNKMNFKTARLTRDYVVPVILKIEGN